MKAWPGRRPARGEDPVHEHAGAAAEDPHVPTRLEGEVLSAHPDSRIRFEARDLQELRRQLDGVVTVRDIPDSGAPVSLSFAPMPAGTPGLTHGAVLPAARGLHARLQVLEKSPLGAASWRFSSQAAAFVGVRESGGSLADAVAAMERSLAPLDCASRNELIRRCDTAGGIMKRCPPEQPETIAAAKQTAAVQQTCKEASAALDAALKVKARCESLRPMLAAASANITAVTNAVAAQRTCATVTGGIRERLDNMEASMDYNEAAVKRAVDTLIRRSDAVTEQERSLRR
jgi:hypothetical protein